jgi:hypothetical protein
LDAEVHINSAWKNIRENKKFSQGATTTVGTAETFAVVQVGMLKLLDQRNQATLQWLQNASEETGII